MPADLTGLSITDAEDWLASPFWEHLQDIVKDRFIQSYEQLRRGDIAVKTKDQDGMIFRSNEALRGAMIEDEFIMLFDKMLLEDVRELTEAVNNEDGEQSETEGENDA